MTLKLILSFVIGFAVSALVGAWLVPFLRRIKAGQSIKEIGPTWHRSKEGTPTMGGLMFIAAVTAVCFVTLTATASCRTWNRKRRNSPPATWFPGA